MQSKAAAGTAASASERLVEEYLAACRARGLAIRTVRKAYRNPMQAEAGERQRSSRPRGTRVQCPQGAGGKCQDQQAAADEVADLHPAEVARPGDSIPNDLGLRWLRAATTETSDTAAGKPTQHAVVNRAATAARRGSNQHLITSAASGAEWLEHHPGFTLLPIDEAFRVSLQVSRRMFEPGHDRAR